LKTFHDLEIDHVVSFQNMEDEIYLKRHGKPEIEEKRRKR
jgi:hypothetical protein